MLSPAETPTTAVRMAAPSRANSRTGAAQTADTPDQKRTQHERKRDEVRVHRETEERTGCAGPGQPNSPRRRHDEAAVSGNQVRDGRRVRIVGAPCPDDDRIRKNRGHGDASSRDTVQSAEQQKRGNDGNEHEQIAQGVVAADIAEHDVGHPTRHSERSARELPIVCAESCEEVSAVLDDRCVQECVGPARPRKTLRATATREGGAPRGALFPSRRHGVAHPPARTPLCRPRADRGAEDSASRNAVMDRASPAPVLRREAAIRSVVPPAEFRPPSDQSAVDRANRGPDAATSVESAGFARGCTVDVGDAVRADRGDDGAGEQRTGEVARIGRVDGDSFARAFELAYVRELLGCGRERVLLAAEAAHEPAALHEAAVFQPSQRALRCRATGTGSIRVARGRRTRRPTGAAADRPPPRTARHGRCRRSARARATNGRRPPAACASRAAAARSDRRRAGWTDAGRPRAGSRRTRRR